MINQQSLHANGIALTRVPNAATLSAMAGTGRLFSYYAASNNTVPVYLQVFDLAAMPSAGAWPAGVTPTIVDIVVGNTTTFNGTFSPVVFEFAVPFVLGCQMVLSTSATSIVLDTVPIFLATQFVADILNGPALPTGIGVGT